MVSLWNTEPAFAAWAALTVRHFIWIPQSSYLPNSSAQAWGASFYPTGHFPNFIVLVFKFVVGIVVIVDDDDDGDVLNEVSYRSR